MITKVRYLTEEETEKLLSSDLSLEMMKKPKLDMASFIFSDNHQDWLRRTGEANTKEP